MHAEQEQSIWNAFKRGEWHAYSRLYEEYYRRLNNYGYKFTRDVALIEDTIQDLFVKLWTNRETLSTPPSVKNYLYKALRHSLFRKLKTQSKLSFSADDDYDYTFEVSYDHQLILREEQQHMQDMVKEVVSKLPPRQQEIVYLRFYEGLSYEEVGEVMSIHINSVYKLWYKALDNLKDTLHYLVCLIWCLCLPKPDPAVLS
jgi:RNA polymerase sigma factor (sigma-70 family)